MTTPIVPQQATDDPFDLEAFLASRPGQAFDVGRFVADSVPFDVEAFVAEAESRRRPSAQEAAAIFAATPRRTLPRELAEFGRGVNVKDFRPGQLGRTVRMPSPRATGAPLITPRVERPLPNPPASDALAFADPPSIEPLKAPVTGGEVRPADQPSDAADLLAGAVERMAAHRDFLREGIGDVFDMNQRASELTLSALEGATSLGQELGLRVPASLAQRAGILPEPVAEFVFDRMTPSERSAELQRRGLRFQPRITGDLPFVVTPESMRPKERELGFGLPVGGLVTEPLLGIKTETDLAEFIGSLPLIIPFFKGPARLAASLGDRATRAAARALGPAVARGAPPVVSRLARAAGGAVTAGTTVGVGSGLLGGVQAVGAGEDLPGILRAATGPLIHEVRSLIDPSQGVGLFRSFSRVGAVAGLLRKPPFAATVSREVRADDLAFREAVFQDMENKNPFELSRVDLEIQNAMISQTAEFHRDIMAPKKLRTMRGRLAVNEVILRPPPDLKTPLDTPEVLAARAAAGSAIQTSTINTAARQQLRTEWLDKVYGEGARRQERRVTLVLGPPAAGKSQAVAKALVERLGALLVDADVFKELIPEFEGGPGAGVVHKESARLAAQLYKRALKAGDNIVMPRVGKSLAGLLEDIRKFHEAGYTIDLQYVDLPIQKAAVRAVIRFYQEGRFVDPFYVLNDVDGFPLRSFEAVKNDPRVSTYRRVNNDVPRSRGPVTVDQGLQRGGAGLDARAGLRGAAPAGGPGRGPPGDPGSPAAAVLARRLEAVRVAHDADAAAGARLAGLARADLARELRVGNVTLAEAQKFERELRQFETDVPLDTAAQLLEGAGLSETVVNSILQGLNEMGTRVTRDILAEAKGDPAVFAKAAGEAVGREAGVSPGLIMNERGSVRLTPDELQAHPNLSDLPAHSRRIQAQLRIGLNDRSLPTMEDIYTAIVRRTFGIESVERTISGASDLPASASPGAAARLAAGSSRRSEGFLEIGPAQWDAQGNLVFSGTPSYKRILKVVADLNKLRRYEVARLTLDLSVEREGPTGARRPEVETGISVEDARLEVADATAVIREAADQSVMFRLQGLEYLAEAGGVSPTLLALARSLMERYVPLNRVFEGKDPMAGGGGTGFVGRVGQQIRRRVGSKRPILDPVESTIDQNRRFIRAGDLNRVALRLIELAEAFPESASGFIERVKEPSGRPSSVEVIRLREAAERRGIEMTEAEAQQLSGILGDRKLDIADGIINVWRDGVEQQWRVSPEVARAIQALRPGDVPMYLQLLGMPAVLMKGGITLNPAFQAFNFIRDTFDATVQSQYGFKLGIDSFRGFYESAKGQWLGDPSQIYQEFVLGGGGFSTQRGQGGRRAQAQLRRILPQSGGRRVLGRIMHPIDAMKEFGAPFEEAARVGEFMRARKQGASVMEGILASQEVTVNFQQIGAQMQGFAYMTAFLNPAIQSMDRAARVGALPFQRLKASRRAGGDALDQAAAFADPAGRALVAAVGSIALPSIMFWLAARDDQEINDLRKTNAGLIYWFVRLSKTGEIIRLPKPFLYGQIFGTGMETALDIAFDKDPEAMGRWAEGMLDQLQANVIPTAGVLVLQQVFNKNLFFQSPIIPRGLENVEPRFQSRATTGTVARRIGDLLNISPARIEQFNRDLFGTLGGEALKAADMTADRLSGGTTSAPTRVSADRLLIGRFFARSPTTNVQPIRKFYDDALKAEEAENSLRINRDNQTRFTDVLTRRQVDLALAPTYAGVRSQLNVERNKIEVIRSVPDAVLSPDRKLESIAEVMRTMIELARATNTIADLMRAQLEAALEGQGGR